MSLRNPMCRSMIVFAGIMYPILAPAKAHACQAYNSCTVNGSYYLEYNNSGTASGGNAATAVQGTTYGGISLVGEDQVWFIDSAKTVGRADTCSTVMNDSRVFVRSSNRSWWTPSERTGPMNTAPLSLRQWRRIDRFGSMGMSQTTSSLTTCQAVAVWKCPAWSIGTVCSQRVSALYLRSSLRSIERTLTCRK